MVRAALTRLPKKLKRLSGNNRNKAFSLENTAEIKLFRLETSKGATRSQPLSFCESWILVNGKNPK